MMVAEKFQYRLSWNSIWLLNIAFEKNMKYQEKMLLECKWKIRSQNYLLNNTCIRKQTFSLIAIIH